MDQSQFENIPQEQFELVQRDDTIFDTKFETKPIGYFKDALLRFRKNKASVVAFVILVLMVIFAIFAPIFSPYGINDVEIEFKQAIPRIALFEGTGFLDGTKEVTLNENDYLNYLNQPGYIVKLVKKKQTVKNGRKVNVYVCRIDVYAVGYKYETFTMEKIEEIQNYEKEKNVQILYPVFDIPGYYDTYTQAQNANFYYQTMQDPALYENYNEMTPEEQKRIAVNNAPNYDENGNIIPLYDPENPEYFRKNEASGSAECRIHYMEYYKMMHNGKTPTHLFGTNNQGQDIMTRLATGARFSLILGVVVALINIIIGICYGAIEGYYGGTVDLIMERVSDILSEIPMMIVAVLFNLYLSQKVGVIPSIGFAFILTGWIGTASRVRMQFYRYKGQEYVLAARTLGARDSRLIFRHILPNAIGTIVTSCILMIPSVIFSESTLSYLGIIDLSTDMKITSVGTVLQEGQGSLQNYPHIILFPALFIAILMVGFNIFGRGLRDALNPSLRGVEE